MIYELHITILSNELTDYKLPPWHFSKIDGDPDLGKGIKCYLTSHLNSEEITLLEAINYMETVASRIQKEGYNVIRCKIEKILYDRRE